MRTIYFVPFAHTSSPLWNDHTAVRPLPIPVHITNRHHYPNWTPRSLPAKANVLSGGVNAANLHPLIFCGKMLLEKAAQQIPDSPPVKSTPLNAWSLSNNTFTLNDNFTSHQLDFLFVTETWLTAGDLTSLGDFCPTAASEIPQRLLVAEVG